MSANAQPIPDLHFDVAPVQIGEQMMTCIRVSDNFGLLQQIIIPPQAAKQFGKYIVERATEAENTLIKPASMIHKT
jgi:hypothetical protein